MLLVTLDVLSRRQPVADLLQHVACSSAGAEGLVEQSLDRAVLRFDHCDDVRT